MRVVLTGTTGFGKDGIARTVARLAAKTRGLPENLDDEWTRKFIQVFSIEEEIKKTLGEFRPFLDQILHRERIRQWSDALRRVLDRASESEHTILCFHNVFHRRSNFFTCVDWDLLRAFRPTVFVTLINDAYDVWETVNSREVKEPSNSHFRMPEILAWRSAEIAATANLADNLFVKADGHGIGAVDRSVIEKQKAVAAVFGKPIRHFVFAVKHPAETLYRLLFRRDFLVVYASFPITKPRQEESLSGRHEINDFRHRLFQSDFLTVLDPLTIDEFRLTSAVPSGQPWLRPRWDLTFGPPMVQEVPLTANPFEGYSTEEFNAFRASVGCHVETRDYQLVSQADCLAAYRPFYGGPLGSGAVPSESPSGGVEKELGFAAIESKQTYAVHPAEDRRGGPKVFQNIDFALQKESVDELLNTLRAAQSRKAQRMNGNGIIKTWEELTK